MRARDLSLPVLVALKIDLVSTCYTGFRVLFVKIYMALHMCVAYSIFVSRLSFRACTFLSIRRHNNRRVYRE